MPQTRWTFLIGSGTTCPRPQMDVMFRAWLSRSISSMSVPRAVPDLISRWVPGHYTSLGTDGFGLSDTRHALRRHFHVDAESVTVAALRQLARGGEVRPSAPAEAAKKYAIDDIGAAPVGETGGDS